MRAATVRPAGGKKANEASPAPKSPQAISAPTEYRIPTTRNTFNAANRHVSGRASSRSNCAGAEVSTSIDYQLTPSFRHRTPNLPLSESSPSGRVGDVPSLATGAVSRHQPFRIVKYATWYLPGGRRFSADPDPHVVRVARDRGARPGAIMQRPSPNPWSRRGQRSLSAAWARAGKGSLGRQRASPAEMKRESPSGSGSGLASVAEQCSDDAFDSR